MAVVKNFNVSGSNYDIFAASATSDISGRNIATEIDKIADLEELDVSEIEYKETIIGEGLKLENNVLSISGGKSALSSYYAINHADSETIGNYNVQLGRAGTAVYDAITLQGGYAYGGSLAIIGANIAYSMPTTSAINGSIAIKGATAQDGGFAAGIGNCATGRKNDHLMSYAFGSYTTANNGAFGFGLGINAGGEGSFIIGKYNSDGSSPFVIGGGTSDNNRKDRFVVPPNLGYVSAINTNTGSAIGAGAGIYSVSWRIGTTNKLRPIPYADSNCESEFNSSKDFGSEACYDTFISAYNNPSTTYSSNSGFWTLGYNPYRHHLHVWSVVEKYQFSYNANSGTINFENLSGSNATNCRDYYIVNNGSARTVNIAWSAFSGYYSKTIKFTTVDDIGKNNSFTATIKLASDWPTTFTAHAKTTAFTASAGSTLTAIGRRRSSSFINSSVL